ncbi:RNA-directed DNA polymerase from mobile element jockey [Trichonephila clavata]|uniref:RNA-directed DNA polymerase from mobile element jockey n=1 Tax=Trichonephila clavata TaxID=2740835 RepID=A0A8X6H2I1_TRICU|nr:RNA-directed DNA polymerase from mobile element jockey [Trichonephila clavata]
MERERGWYFALHANICINIRNSTPLQHRPPPPITIDNVDKSAHLLKRLQDLTGQKLVGRTIGKSLRVYPQTPLAYKKIRQLIDEEQLESFTHQLSEEKDIKIVITGMPVDMPIPEIVEDLHNLGITVNECKIMTNRKTGLPMPLFLLTLPQTEDNKNIFNISELCFMKDCKKTLNEEPTCCHCQGNHPANFLGCPKNPLNRTPPPPKVNAWEEQIKKRKELQEAAKQKALLANQAPTQTRTQPAQTSNPPVQTRPRISANKAPLLPESSIPPQSPNEIFSTLSQLKDLEVKEMLDVLTQFVRISKSNKSRAEKFSELYTLLQPNPLNFQSQTRKFLPRRRFLSK